MEQTSVSPTGSENKILTIPNLLSFLRLCMIPVFVWLYCFKKDYTATGIVLILSGATDLIDGFIARTFHMISNLGKILDPVADKLTQAAILVCLVTRFPLMLLAFAVLFVKEIAMSITGLLVIKKTGKVYGADWHGKVATFLLYAVMILHVFWAEIPALISNITIVLCIAVMLLSFGLYLTKNIRTLRSDEK